MSQAGSFNSGGPYIVNLRYTNVDTSPYVVLPSDSYLSVDTSTIPITIQLPVITTPGRTFYIKDRTGDAGTNNITVESLGGILTIDGLFAYEINTDFEAINLIFNGTDYEVW